jgi:uncharacterized protein YbbC (DUF1343 family)
MRGKTLGTLGICVLALLQMMIYWSRPRSGSADAAPRVLNGIDILRRENFRPLTGRHVGLITNHTGRAVDGVSTIDLLNRSEACDLAALFSPEHGLRGIEDSRVDTAVDESTGIPVFSLYGDLKKPTPEMLRGIDALVFDIQDIGARFYTYITTMAYCMEAAAGARIPFYVLDRPNPIGGVQVEGPMLDKDKTSFIGYMPLPIRHGMTVGELARYFNKEKGIGVELHVIEMEGWKRNYYFWDTGQLWVNPSPNMRNMTAAVFYPGVCLLEQTNVSVGRGTDTPFEVVGAPWVEPVHFAAALREKRMEGVEFVPVRFTPQSSTHRGEECGGVRIVMTEASRIHSVRLGLNLVLALKTLYPEAFEFRDVMRLLGNEKAMEILQSERDPEEALLEDEKEMREFLVRRRQALIYNPIS